MNIMDYIKYYGNKTFDLVPLNEVDALIFSCLCYLNFDKIIKAPMKLESLAEEYFKKVTKENFKKQVNVGKLYSNCFNLFNLMKHTLRYKDLVITDYKKYVDLDTQFGAMVFKSKKFKFFAFEGTNNYISGWKEDFNLSYQFPVYSQVLAKEIIENNVSLFDTKIYVGGHSKGGNLAVTGSMLSNNSIKKKIVNIFDFDGPGVKDKEFDSEDYHKIANKIIKIVPRESMVGMIMNSVEISKTVKSSSVVILQHDPFTWKCYGSFFLEDKLSNKSKKFKKNIEDFLNQYPKESVEELVNVVFDMFKEGKIEKTRGISIKQIAKSTKYIRNLKSDKNTKEKLEKLISIIINYINDK